MPPADIAVSVPDAAGPDLQPTGPAAEPRADGPGSAPGTRAGQPAAGEAGQSAGAPARDAQPQPPAGEPREDPDAVQVSIVPGITRYHRSDCLLIRFLTEDDLDLVTRQAAKESGCVPCKACKPDQESADVPVG